MEISHNHDLTCSKHNTIQSKVKKFLKERKKALIASLEHEDVLIHSLLDIFSTSLLVQKIAT
jgi:hypothetical protein